MTTGGGTVRFNPNLYANGKVCLRYRAPESGRVFRVARSLTITTKSSRSCFDLQMFLDS